MEENLKIRELRERLIKLLNEYPVCIETKRLVVGEIMSELQTEANKAIQKEIEMFNEKNKKSEESEVE